MNSLRLRIEFEACAGAQQVYIRQWCQVDEHTTKVGQLAEQLVDMFKLGTSNILLSLRGFPLSPDSPVTLLREGDIVVVNQNNLLQLSGTRLDITRGSLVTSDHEILLPLQADRATQKNPTTDVQKVNETSEAKPTAQGRQQLQPSTARLERSEERSSSEAEQTPPPKETGVGAAPKTARSTPSRNAVRKKLKRKQIREGLLPYPPKRRREVESLPALKSLPLPGLPRLPKRGDAALLSNSDPNVAEFMKTGHVRFADSDNEAPQEALEEKIRAAEEPLAAATDTELEDAPDEEPDTLPAGTGAVSVANFPASETAQAPMHPPAPQIVFDSLPRVDGLPIIGAVVAYKILELDEDCCPKVSEWRCGRVVSITSPTSFSMKPWPSSSRRIPTAKLAGFQGPGAESPDPEDEDDTVLASLEDFTELRSVTKYPAASAAAPSSKVSDSPSVVIRPTDTAPPAGGSAHVMVPRILRSHPSGGVHPFIRPIPRMNRTSAASSSPALPISHLSPQVVGNGAVDALPKSADEPHVLLTHEIASAIAKRTAELSAAANEAAQDRSELASTPSLPSGGKGLGLEAGAAPNGMPSTGHKSRIRGPSMGRFLARLREEGSVQPLEGAQD